MMRQIALFLTVAIGVGKAQAQASAQVGTLEIIVADAFGKTMRAFDVTVASPEDEQGNSTTLHTLHKSGSITLPYGDYIVKGSASLHAPFARPVNIRRPRSLILVAFTPVQWGEASSYASLAGRVANFDIPLKNWVRVISVFGDLSKEAPITDKGEFEIADIPDGDYFVMVMHDLTVLTVQRFAKTVQENRILVDVKAHPPL